MSVIDGLHQTLTSGRTHLVEHHFVQAQVWLRQLAIDVDNFAVLEEVDVEAFLDEAAFDAFGGRTMTGSTVESINPGNLVICEELSKNVRAKVFGSVSDEWREEQCCG